jgi:VanZ family protein
MIKWFEQHNKFSWGITILGAILIFYISSLSFKDTVSSAGGGILPVIYHILAFSMFGFFLLISITQGKKDYLKIFFGILFAIWYAISDEIHQFFVPGRVCSYGDLFLDSVGIIFALMMYLVVLEYRK